MKQLVSYCESTSECRHALIRRYFDDSPRPSVATIAPALPAGANPTCRPTSISTNVPAPANAPRQNTQSDQNPETRTYASADTDEVECDYACDFHKDREALERAKQVGLMPVDSDYYGGYNHGKGLRQRHLLDGYRTDAYADGPPIGPPYGVRGLVLRLGWVPPERIDQIVEG